MGHVSAAKTAVSTTIPAVGSVATTVNATAMDPAPVAIAAVAVSTAILVGWITIASAVDGTRKVGTTHAIATIAVTAITVTTIAAVMTVEPATMAITTPIAPVETTATKPNLYSLRA